MMLVVNAKWRSGLVPQSKPTSVNAWGCGTRRHLFGQIPAELHRCQLCSLLTYSPECFALIPDVTAVSLHMYTMPSQSTISSIPPANVSVCSTTRLPCPPAPISATQLTVTGPATPAVQSSSPTAPVSATQSTVTVPSTSAVPSSSPPAQHSVNSVTQPASSSTSLAASPNARKK